MRGEWQIVPRGIGWVSISLPAPTIHEIMEEMKELENHSWQIEHYPGNKLVCFVVEGLALWQEHDESTADAALRLWFRINNKGDYLR